MSPGFYAFGILLGGAAMIYAAKTGNWWLVLVGWIILGTGLIRLIMTT